MRLAVGTLPPRNTPAAAGFGQPMSLPKNPVFSFEEADHLTRIHIKLGLEDLGFPVREEDHQIIIDDPTPPEDPAD